MPASRHGQRVRLSSFRVLERLPGAAHPAVYAIRFACGCGDEHDALVPHDELDWAPLGLGARPDVRESDDGPYRGCRPTSFAANGRCGGSRRGSGRGVSSATSRNARGPVTPSAFLVLAPGEATIGLAVSLPRVWLDVGQRRQPRARRLPVLERRDVGVVRHVFGPDALRTIEQFRAELASAAFDQKRLELEHEPRSLPVGMIAA